MQLHRACWNKETFSTHTQIWYYTTLSYNNTFLEVFVKSDNFANKHYDRRKLENKQAQKPAVNETSEMTIFLLFTRNKEPHVCQE